MGLPGLPAITTSLFHLHQDAIGSGLQLLITNQGESELVDLILQYLFYREPVFGIVWLRKRISHIEAII